MKKVFKGIMMTGLIFWLTGCASVGKFLNPFYEDPPPEALLGVKNDEAISGGKKKSGQARAALDAMSTYRRGQLPEPTDPVIQPAVVRLMWIPDHLNPNGDLVPQHFYYLKVLEDRWAVKDEFELEQQLNNGSKVSNVPYSNVSDAY